MNGGRQRPRARGGFTLVELLTVIAIIAILAAILFPVLGSMGERARSATCMSNIRVMCQALKIYHDDHHVYPDELYRALYPNYVKDEKQFNCPNSPAKMTDRSPVTAANPITTAARAFPAFDSYDFQWRNDLSSTTGPAEIHYTRFWTGTQPSLSADKRQLMFRDPPDTTVVTWCLYHTKPNASGAPSPNTMALVGFLSGRVQEIPAEKLANWTTPGQYPWQVQPK